MHSRQRQVDSRPCGASKPRVPCSASSWLAPHLHPDATRPRFRDLISVFHMATQFTGIGHIVLRFGGMREGQEQCVFVYTYLYQCVCMRRRSKGNKELPSWSSSAEGRDPRPVEWWGGDRGNARGTKTNRRPCVGAYARRSVQCGEGRTLTLLNTPLTTKLTHQPYGVEREKSMGFLEEEKRIKKIVNRRGKIQSGTQQRKSTCPYIFISPPNEIHSLPAFISFPLSSKYWSSEREMLYIH